MKFLTDEQLSELLPAETSSFPSPVPTQIVSSDEYLPVPQTEKQREVEARLKDISDRLARRQGVSRRRFFQTAAGMAASFVAMNQVFGHIFDASVAEAATPDMAADRAQALSGQFIIDGHTHFLRDDTRLTGFVKMRNAFGKLGWNKELTGDQTIDDLKYANYIKEVYMDSDTKVALLSNSPSDVPQDWFIPQAQVFETRDEGQQASRLAADDGAFHDHPRPARLARPGRSGDRDLQARFVEGLHRRRQHAQGTRRLSVACRRRKADVSVLREDRRNRASRMSASTRGCSRPASKSSFRGCGPMPTSAISARRPRTGRN